MTVENAGSAVVSGIGIKTGNAVGPGLGKGVGTCAPKTGTGTEKNKSEKTAPVADAANEKGIVVGQGEGAVEAGREVETGRDGAGAGIARETGNEERGWMERRELKETVFQSPASAFQRSRKEKRAKVEMIAETGSETGTGGGATGTGTDVGGSGTETGSTREIVETETEESGERSATVLRGRKWLFKEMGAMRRMEARHTWRSTARMQ